MSKCRFVGSKPALHKVWSLNVVSTALKSGIQSCEEVVEMSSNDTGSLLHGCHWSTHDECKGQHRPRQVLDRHLEYDEMCFLSTIVLCKGVDEGQHEGSHVDGRAKKVSCTHLENGQRRLAELILVLQL